GRKLREQIRVGGGAGIQRDGSRISAGVITRVFQCFPRALQEQSLLRVHDRSFRRAIAEEGGIKQIYVIHYGAGGHVFTGSNIGGESRVLRKEGDRLHAFHQIAPKLRDRSGSGETSSHSNDGDICTSSTHDSDPSFTRVCLVRSNCRRIAPLPRASAVEWLCAL